MYFINYEINRPRNDRPAASPLDANFATPRRGKQKHVVDFQQTAIPSTAFNPRQMVGCSRTICRVHCVRSLASSARRCIPVCRSRSNAGISFLLVGCSHRGNVLMPSIWQACSFPLNNYVVTLNRYVRFHPVYVQSTKEIQHFVVNSARS